MKKLPQKKKVWILCFILLVSVLTVQMVVIGKEEESSMDETSPIHSVGAGSYTTVYPPRAVGVQRKIYQTPNFPGKMPTNKWWTSLAWDCYSKAQYPHPLAVMAGPNGLRIYYPGAKITANSTGVYGLMPVSGLNDLVISHTNVPVFPEALVDYCSDWLVTAAFLQEGKGMKLTYGHGSPYVFARFSGGGPRLLFAEAPQVWYGANGDSVLGVSINGNHYGLFGPTGSAWQGVGTKELTNDLAGKDYFSLALLPEDSVAVLTEFRKVAHNHPIDTRVEWAYDEEKSLVCTEYRFSLTQLEPGAEGTIFAMYPHQWRNTTHPLLPYTYSSVRGLMKTAKGESFSTELRYHGVLPALPVTEETDLKALADLLEQDKKEMKRGSSDTYWTGKYLGKLATLAAIAREAGLSEDEDYYSDQIKEELAEWFSAVPKLTTQQGDTLLPEKPAAGKGKKVFYYNENWGTLIGYPTSFGSETELNDHHFHYGYFIRAAAQAALTDPGWATPDEWGGMVNLLIKDIACPDRSDPLFPFLRCFDVYSGHSWASGSARYDAGNNQESSSEALNAWTGIILWGEAIGDRGLRDLGIFLYTTEMHAVHEYWFDSSCQNFPPEYPASVVTIVWGGQGVHTTWWTANAEEVHGINWLPFHGGSLYLGLNPEYVLKDYNRLVQENNGDHWDKWGDLIWMWLALADPAEAIRHYSAAAEVYQVEEGNSHTNLYHWLYTLNALGRVDDSVVADTSLYAVFNKEGRRTYVAYNPSSSAKTITFSNGFKLIVQPKRMAWASSQTE